MGNKSTFEMPTPDVLAQKAKQRSIPISIRMKEDTYSFFVNLAGEHRTNVGSVINKLLDIYSEQYSAMRQNEQNNGVETVFIKYLNSCVDKIANTSNEELLSDHIPEEDSDIDPDAHPEIVEEERERVRQYKEIAADIEAQKPNANPTFGNDDRHSFTFQWPMGSILLVPNESSKATLTTVSKKAPNFPSDLAITDFGKRAKSCIMMPLQKWLIICEIFSLFTHKYAQVFDTYVVDHDVLTMTLDEQKQFVDAINQADARDRKAFTQAMVDFIAKILRESDNFGGGY